MKWRKQNRNTVEQDETLSATALMMWKALLTLRISESASALVSSDQAEEELLGPFDELYEAWSQCLIPALYDREVAMLIIFFIDFLHIVDENAIALLLPRFAAFAASYQSQCALKDATPLCDNNFLLLALERLVVVLRNVPQSETSRTLAAVVANIVTSLKGEEGNDRASKRIERIETALIGITV